MLYASRLLVHTFISAWKSQQMLGIQELLSAFGLKGLGLCPSSRRHARNACAVRFAEHPCKPFTPISQSCKGTFSGSAISSLPDWLGSCKPSSITSAEAESTRFSFSTDNINLKLILLFVVTHQLPQSKTGQPWHWCLTAGGLLASSVPF